jgi:NADH-quinone oxidoreductase subunit J
MTVLLFAYFSGVIVCASLLVVSLKNPIYGTISLLVMFAHVAGLYVLLNAEFIAAVQVVVYAGAILVLYLFVVMLLNVKREDRFQRQLFAALLVAGLLLAEVALVVVGRRFPSSAGEFPSELIQSMGSTKAIGQTLFTDYLLPFEVASLILLVAMVGAIVLAKKAD